MDDGIKKEDSLEMDAKINSETKNSEENAVRENLNTDIPIMYRSSYPFRKSGMPQEPPASQPNTQEVYIPETSLQEYYAESLKESETRQKSNRQFHKFVAAVMIFAIIGAPFLGLGIGMGARFFDSYFLPILLDDSAERAEFSFDNINMPLRTVPNNTARPNYVELVKLVEPSVVLITSVIPSNIGSRGFDFNMGITPAAGSGIIMAETSTRFYIATNAHVIEGAIEVHVSIEGSDKIPAVPVGRDSDADLAVIAIYKSEAIQRGVTAVRTAQFGDSDSMMVGEIVLAIGNSMGEGNTVTNGIISAVNREISVMSRHLEVIQTNAAINRGNSGGPLVNIYGQVIGINTAKFSEQLAEGMGYAIPSNLAMPILERIMRGEEAARRPPMIGIGVLNIDEGLPNAVMNPNWNITYYEMQEILSWEIESGVMVISVEDGTPASEAGLARFDVIVAVDGSPVHTHPELVGTFAAMNVGDEVTLSIIRGGEPIPDVVVTLGPNTQPITF